MPYVILKDPSLSFIGRSLFALLFSFGSERAEVETALVALRFSNSYSASAPTPMRGAARHALTQLLYASFIAHLLS